MILDCYAVMLAFHSHTHIDIGPHIYWLLYPTYILGIFAQVHQHLLKNVERPSSKDVDKMESTLLTLDVENRLTSTVIWRMEGGLFSREEEMDLRISTGTGQTMSLDLGTSREAWTGPYTLLDLSSTENRTKSWFSRLCRELQICSIFLLLCRQQWNKLQTKHSRLYRNCWRFTNPT